MYANTKYLFVKLIVTITCSYEFVVPKACEFVLNFWVQYKCLHYYYDYKLIHDDQKNLDSDPVFWGVGGGINFVNCSDPINKEVHVQRLAKLKQFCEKVKKCFIPQCENKMITFDFELY